MESARFIILRLFAARTARLTLIHIKPDGKKSIQLIRDTVMFCFGT